MVDREFHANAGPCSRRGFITSAIAGAAGSGVLAWGAGLAAGRAARAADPADTPARAPAASQSPDAPSDTASGKLVPLCEHLAVFQGPIQVGVLRHGEKAWLIDCTGAGLAHALAQAGVRQVERILFTHYHREQTCGARGFAARGAQLAVPAEEKSCFADPGQYWNDPRWLWRVSASFRPDHLLPVEPLPVDVLLGDGDELQFGPARIKVLATPGHTDGAVSLLVEVDGRRVIFCGDVLAGEGRLQDVYSLQRGFSRGGRRVGAYHGFLGDQWRLAESLRLIAALKPDCLVPAHGRPIEPAAQVGRAIDGLLEHLQTCYRNYVAISALRHYFPELFTDFEGLPGQMPIRPGFAPPECLRHFGTTWMLVSKSKAALVMDAGSPGVVKRLEEMLESGEISSVEGLWVTHYHGDHTEGIPAFQQRFDCPTLADRRLAEVLTRPTAWRLPCVMPQAVRVERTLEDGESWQWREFKLTSFHYPGQTLYHGALLAEHGELRVLFVGDSHTPAGNDDYCAYNRNWLGRGVGFQHCLDLVERLGPTHMFNCHVRDAFRFTPGEIAWMRKNLDQREELFGRLVAWEHANFGLDPLWVRCDPYTQQAAAGKTARLGVVFTNHATAARRAACRLVCPRSLGGRHGNWHTLELAAKTEGRIELECPLPAGVPAGRHVIVVDVEFGDRQLPRFAEAIVDVG